MTAMSASADPFLLGSSNYNISDAQLYSNCHNKSFGCLKVPDGCSEYGNGEDDIPCALAASWIGTSPNTYAVHLHANALTEDKLGYIALGFPQAGLMGPAPVVACDQNHESARVSHIHFGLSNSLQVFWNTKEYKNKPAFNHTMETTSFKRWVHEFGGKLFLTLSKDFDLLFLR